MLSDESILRQRAARFARASSNETETLSREVILFSRDGETYAVPPASVREVSPQKAITVLPGVPAHIVGLINLRSRIVAVVDLAALFGRHASIDSTRSKILIVAEAEKEFGLLVDDLIGMQLVMLGEGAAGSRSLDAKYFRGFLPDGRPVLDLAAIAEQSVVNQQI